MTGLVVFTVIDVLLLIAGLAFYLFWVGSLLTRIAGNLEECADTVREIVGHAKLIGPAVEHINQTGGVELVGELTVVPDGLAVTDSTVNQVSVGAVRYAGSVAKLLG